MKKIHRMNEAAWVLGILLCNLGIALCTKANLGLSMIAAPPYILSRYFGGIAAEGGAAFFSFLTQGTCEYIWQGLLLLLLCLIIRRFRPRYLLAALTAVLSGFTLDGFLWLLHGYDIPTALPLRILLFAAGMVVTALAIAFFFRTDLPLSVYELVVVEIARRFSLSTGRVKQVNDLCMLAISLLLDLLLLGGFCGVGWGTLIISLVNAPLISLFGRWLDRIFDFDPLFPALTKTLIEK